MRNSAHDPLLENRAGKQNQKRENKGTNVKGCCSSDLVCGVLRCQLAFLGGLAAPEIFRMSK